MLLPLTGEQYAGKVTENCVAFWKAVGLYTDAEGVAVEKFKEAFKPETFPPGASILFTHSSTGVLTVSTTLPACCCRFFFLSSFPCEINRMVTRTSADVLPRSVPFRSVVGRLLQGLVGAGVRRRGDREQAPLRGRAGVHHRGARRVAGREAEPRGEGVGAPHQGNRRGRRRAAGGARLGHRLSERAARRKRTSQSSNQIVSWAACHLASAGLACSEDMPRRCMRICRVASLSVCASCLFVAFWMCRSLGNI